MTSPQQAAVILAEVIKNLAALISHELDADAGEDAVIQDPQRAHGIERVMLGGRRALAVLDEPQMKRILATAPTGVQRQAKPQSGQRSVRFYARFGSECPACGDDIEAGDPVAWSSGDVVHDNCAEEAGVEVYERG